jgi:hypothetical protein
MWVDKHRKWAQGISWVFVLGLVGGILHNILVPPQNLPAAASLLSILAATLLPSVVSADKVKAFLYLLLASWKPPSPPLAS